MTGRIRFHKDNSRYLSRFPNDFTGNKRNSNNPGSWNPWTYSPDSSWIRTQDNKIKELEYNNKHWNIHSLLTVENKDS